MRVEVGSSLRPLALRDASSACFARQLNELGGTSLGPAHRMQILLAAIEQARDAIIVTTADLRPPGPRIIFVNHRFTEITGYTADEVLNEPPSVLQGPKTDPQVLDRLQRELGEGKTFSGYAVNYKKDGSEFVADWSIAPVRDEAGNTMCFVAVQRDVTRARVVEDELHAARVLMDRTQEVASIASFSSDGASLLQWSSTFCRLHGLDERTFSGAVAEVDARIHPNDRARVSLARSLAATVGRYEVEHRVLSPEGSVRWLSVHAVLERDPTTGRALLLGIAQDVTSRKLAEQLADQATHSQKMEAVGRLAGGVAHDFNNMLSVILGFAGVVREELPAADPLHKDVTEIYRAAKRAADLTRQLLAFSRKQVLEPKIVDLNGALGEMSNMLVRLLGEDVRLKLNLSQAECRALVDPTQFEQVVMNLVVNARDAVSRGGTITLETANVQLGPEYVSLHPGVTEGAYVLVAVSDDGPGIPRELQRHIFEPFFTTKTGSGGTGLGLATVFGIVSQSNGHIYVYSEPGHGTTFKVYLPLVSAGGARKNSGTMVAPSRLSGTETVLLVEDEDLVRRYVRRVLEKHGYTVLEAANGGEALMLAEEHPSAIDILLTDVVLPRLSGRKIAERLLATRPATRVLYMSGYTENVITQRGVLDESVEFVQKPVAPETLLAKIRGLLDSPTT